MKLLKKFESYSQEREEMCQYLCRCGYAQEELDMCSEEELRQMCRDHEEENYNNEEETLESKKSKNLRGLKEHQEHENYMFFGNLKTIKRLVDEMLEMDESEVDSILSNGHGWATDHIATSKDDIEEVFNFLASHESPDHGYAEPSHEETEGHLSNKDLEQEMGGIKKFDSFK
jgi:ATP-dependent Zn protease